MCWIYSAKGLRGTFFRSTVLSVPPSSCFLSDILPCAHHPPWQPWTPNSVFPTPGFFWALPSFLSQYWSLEIHSRKITGAMIGLISFASPLSGITILHCLQLMSENHCFSYLSQFIHWVRNKEGKARDLLLQSGLKHMFLLIYDDTKLSRMLEGSKEGIIGWCMLLLLLSHFSRVRLCATPQTAVHQTPPSLGFSRQEHWSGLPFPSPREK